MRVNPPSLLTAPSRRGWWVASPLSNQAYRALDLTTAPPLTARALEMAELLVVTTALLAFWRWSGVRAGLSWRPSPVQLGVAGLLVLPLLGAYRGGGSSAR